MLSERDIEAAHPEAFDFVFGNLPDAKRAEFSHHLTGCRYCRDVVDQYSEIGGIIKSLPPHVEPPAGLEQQTTDGMVAALAEQRAEADRRTDTEDQAATRPHPVPQPQRPDEPETQVHPKPPVGPPTETAPPMVTPLPVWRRHRGRLAALAAVAAAIVVAAIVIPLNLGQGPAGPTVVIPLHATAAAKVFGVGAATGHATARPAGASWTFRLSVHGLKALPGNEVYECWWAARGSSKHHPSLVTGGSFVVGASGATTLTMTTGVDPRQFRTMKITAQLPGDGALHGPVLLAGHTV